MHVRRRALVPLFVTQACFFIVVRYDSSDRVLKVHYIPEFGLNPLKDDHVTSVRVALPADLYSGHRICKHSYPPIPEKREAA